MSVIVEGPYGTHCPVERYDAVLLVAGGIGITGVIPYVEYLTKKRAVSKILFVWIVQHTKDVFWMEDRIKDLFKQKNKVEIEIFANRDYTHTRNNSSIEKIDIAIGGHSNNNLMVSESFSDVSTIVSGEEEPKQYLNKPLPEKPLSFGSSVNQLVDHAINNSEDADWKEVIRTGYRPDISVYCAGLFLKVQ